MYEQKLSELQEENKAREESKSRWNSWKNKISTNVLSHIHKYYLSLAYSLPSWKKIHDAMAEMERKLRRLNASRDAGAGTETENRKVREEKVEKFRASFDPFV